MQVAGTSLAKKTEALIKEYHRQSNIQQTIDALSQAFPGMIQSKPNQFISHCMLTTTDTTHSAITNFLVFEKKTFE